MCARNIALCREHKMRVGEAMGMFNMAAFLHMNGELGQARGYYDDALKLLREVGNLRNEAIALSNMSTFQRSLGDLKAAEETCLRALEVCRRAGHRRFEAINNSNLAGMLHERGLNEDALKHHREAIRIQREIGDSRHEGLSLGNLAGFYSDLGELGRAQAAYADGLALLEKSGTQDLGGAIRGLRGQFRLLLGDRAGAAEDLQVALWSLEGVGATAMRAECVLMLKVRLAVDRALEEQDSDALKEAQATLAEMAAVAQKGGYGASSGLGRAVTSGRNLLDEVQAAGVEGRAARVYCGHLPAEISSPAQAALIARALARGGKAPTSLSANVTAPDWRAVEYE
jgi:tetratricopeptide (TPR) repeat protein